MEEDVVHVLQLIRSISPALCLPSTMCLRSHHSSQTRARPLTSTLASWKQSMNDAINTAMSA